MKTLFSPGLSPLGRNRRLWRLYKNDCKRRYKHGPDGRRLTPRGEVVKCLDELRKWASWCDWYTADQGRFAYSLGNGSLLPVAGRSLDKARQLIRLLPALP